MMKYPSSSSSSAYSANVLVEKATSEFLSGPDWTINIDICDAINLNHGLAKDVVKALKKRLQHKNPHVHLLALTLLETMVKNCGDHVHAVIIERNVLQDMIKIVKKKTTMGVREKILVLLDSWQEAFGGAGGKYPQFYWSYEELRRSGVEFPQRASDSVLIFTPQVTHSTAGHAFAGYGIPSSSSTTLEEALASEVETLSMSSISSMQEVLDLLSAMLQAVDTNDRTAIQDEVIVDLVEQCRSNHKKLMPMLTTTGDEELLAKGLELNDNIQNELAKHDAIALNHVLPTEVINSKPQLSEVPNSSLKGDEDSWFRSSPHVVPCAPLTVETKHVAEEEEEEDDEFAQLARRHSKIQPAPSQDKYVGVGETQPSLSNALASTDPLNHVKTTKEQDMIDFLSLTLSSTGTHILESSSLTMQQASGLPSAQESSFNQQKHTGKQVDFSGHVAAWAQPQIQQQQLHHQIQPQPQIKAMIQPQPQSLPAPQPPLQPESRNQSQQPLFQIQSQSPQFSSGYPPSQPQPPQFQTHAQSPQFPLVYPPPPWAATSGYYANPAQQSSTASNGPVQGTGSLQQVTSAHHFESKELYCGEHAQLSSMPRGDAFTAGQTPFIPTYRLFEDRNVWGNGDGRYKTNTSPSL
ncbi:hypothetical protein DCAR_0415425 [Daucus carota subsp. sativus]|uniref:VHS domain-containing protein n=1 Tax=Daucus carota subsp. sativus TaxID=79200 RepID=A0AAF0WU46_DAUCS|nr:PREDICTED: target of Myb protein 1-like [Daucus carota subsp. sativus]WOG96095.1 hypothetical protein DCAR_0415425 [Daucus carota subsp. sativus]